MWSKLRPACKMVSAAGKAVGGEDHRKGKLFLRRHSFFQVNMGRKRAKCCTFGRNSLRRKTLRKEVSKIASSDSSKANMRMVGEMDRSGCHASFIGRAASFIAQFVEGESQPGLDWRGKRQRQRGWGKVNYHYWLVMCLTPDIAHWRRKEAKICSCIWKR